jgi:predicted dinucleotide-binding enzyme
VSTAIIGVGKIGQALATHLTGGGEAVILAASQPAPAEQHSGTRMSRITRAPGGPGPSSTTARIIPAIRCPYSMEG